MKNINILSAIASVALLWGVSACQSPEELVSTPNQESLHSITASFLGDESFENKFEGEIDLENGEIRIIFPYNYPIASDNQITTEQLKKVKVVASIHNNVTFSPSLGIMDLNESHIVTMTDQYGVKHQLKLYAVIRKSAACEITDFEFVKKVKVDRKKWRLDTISSVVMSADSKINVLYSEDTLGRGAANVLVSPHATISPNPSDTLDYNEGVEFTVTAQNGVDKKVWLVQRGFPAKLKRGIRQGSEQLLWVQKLSAIGYDGAAEGVSSQNGLAPTGEYVLVNQIGTSKAVYLNRKDGSIAGYADFGDIVPNGGNTGNYCATADDAGHIIVCNTDKVGTSSNFKIWKLEDVNSKPVEILSDAVYYNYRGHHISVTGDVNKDAIITLGANSDAPCFFRYEIKNGQFVSTKPTEIYPGGYTNGAWTNCDVVYLKPNTNSDYLVNCYSQISGCGALADNRYASLHGSNNVMKSISPWFDPNGSTAGPNSPNWINAQIDCIDFNNITYVSELRVNTFPWGTDNYDTVMLYELSGGRMTNAADFSNKRTNKAAIWEKYGAKDSGNPVGLGGPANGVEMQVSADGYYLYLYFMFAKGQIGCVRLDCFDMQ